MCRDIVLLVIKNYDLADSSASFPCQTLFSQHGNAQNGTENLVGCTVLSEIAGQHLGCQKDSLVGQGARLGLLIPIIA